MRKPTKLAARAAQSDAREYVRAFKLDDAPVDGKPGDVRRAAVMQHNAHLSTAEIESRIAHASTLISLYDAQRMRAKRLIAEAHSDTKTASQMIDTLNNDIDVLHRLVQGRRRAIATS